MQFYSPGDSAVPGFTLLEQLSNLPPVETWRVRFSGGGESTLFRIVTISQASLGARLQSLRQLRHAHLVDVLGIWLKNDQGQLLENWEDDNAVLAQAAELLVITEKVEVFLDARLAECQQQGLTGLLVDELLETLEVVARTLDFLHEQTAKQPAEGRPLAHGQISPRQIFRVGRTVKLLDPALLSLLGEPAGQTSPYQAPELLLNQPANPSSDEYSLAVSFVLLRTGHLPLSASDRNDLLGVHLTGRFDLTGLSEAEMRVIRRSMSFKAEDRYPSCREFVEALQKAQLGETNSGLPPMPTLNIADMIVPGFELVPGFRLRKLIGKGGYGEVWEAMAPGDVPCALKIIRNLDASRSAQEFGILEMLKQLYHSHLMLVAAYWLLNRVGEDLRKVPEGDPERTQAVMLVVQNELASMNLAQRLQECRREGLPGIPLDELLGYMRQSAQAIDYLNARQHHLGDKLVAIQHRDIKPENILLSRNHEVKIADFGLAKVVEGTSTSLRTQSQGMTVAYAAPELFHGQVTSWTDQYALALTYYRLRTGRFPFDASQSLEMVMFAHLHGQLDYSGLEGEEEAVLRRATSVKAEQRFENNLRMVEALELATTGALHPIGGITSPVTGMRPRLLLPSGTGPLPSDLYPTRPTPDLGLGGPAVGLGSDSHPSGRHGKSTNPQVGETAPPSAAPQQPVPVPAPRRSRTARWLTLGISVLVLAGVMVLAAKMFRPVNHASDNAGKIAQIEELIGLGKFQEAVTQISGSALDEKDQEVLRSRLRLAWLSRIRGLMDARQPQNGLQELRTFFQSYPEDAEALGLQRVLSGGGLPPFLPPPELIVRRLLERIAKGEFALAEEILNDIPPPILQAQPKVKTLVSLVRLAVQTEKNPASKSLAELQAELVKHKQAGSLDGDELRPFEQFVAKFRPRQVEDLARTLPDNPDWAAVLATVDQPGGSGNVWGTALRVEALAELKLARMPITGWEEAQAALKRLTLIPPEVAPYLAYVHAVAAQANEAQDLASQVRRFALSWSERKIPAGLTSPYRVRRAVTLLTTAAQPFLPTTLQDPGMNRGDFLYPLLDRAYQLAGEQASADLKLGLTLAAWFQTKPEPEQARLLSQQVLRDLDARKTVHPVAYYLASEVRTFTGGATGAVEGGLLATELADRLMREATSDDQRQQIAQHLQTQLLRRVLEGVDRYLVGAPTVLDRLGLVRLNRRLAELVRQDLWLWSSVEGVGPDPLPRIAQLITQAVTLADAPDLSGRLSGPERAELLLLKGFALIQLVRPDLEAVQECVRGAKMLIKEDAPMLALEGIIQALHSLVKEDYRDRVAGLKSAEATLAKALEKPLTLGQLDLKPLVLAAQARVNVDWGNYLFSEPARIRRSQTARQLASEAVKLANNRDSLTNLALGLSLESLSRLRVEDRFKDAIAEYDRSMGQHGATGDRLRSRLARGRCYLNWAESLKRTNPAEMTEKLKLARADLENVRASARATLDGVEAGYWLARADLVEGDFVKADAHLEETLLMAQGMKDTRVWQTTLLEARGAQAIEAITAKRTPPADKTWSAVAEQSASLLDLLSPPRAALIRLSVARRLGLFLTPSEFDKGIKWTRSQDVPWVIALYRARAVYRMSNNDAAGAEQDRKSADALAGEFNVESEKR